MRRVVVTGLGLVTPLGSDVETTVRVEPGSTLVLYTDGLTEAVDSADEEFGLERLSRAVAERRDHPVNLLCGEILSRVAEFASGMPQYDDQTLMFLRRTETPG